MEDQYENIDLVFIVSFLEDLSADSVLNYEYFRKLRC